MRNKKIVIAGGGTGGHIFPAVAIANAIRKEEPGTEILFIGAKGKMEMEKVPQAGYRIEGLDIAGFNRSSLIKNITLPFKLIRSLLQVKSIFRAFRPDAAIGVGGYSSFPVLKYAQQRRIPSFIHESNSFAGKANIMLGKNATMVFVAAEGMDKFFPREKIRLTGNPVRSSIAHADIRRADAVNFFGLEPAKPAVLSVGGSLGAQSINQAIADGLDRFVENGIQLIWQTGKPFAQQGRQAAGGKEGIWVGDFITDMGKAYAAADLVVSRAGAMAITEISVAGKPCILVPYPFASEDHQTANARRLAEKNAGVMIADKDANTRLVDTVLELASKPEQRAILSANVSKMAVRDADVMIARAILDILYKKENQG
jgi:UDP-N-acetylglucosamine--N-acetylmuramyl-(pentapeptide) pyrophosphoryl-undecaprenol N-acetylglucosamine transferase